MKVQDCFRVLAFDLISERYVVATTSEAISYSIVLYSCEGFSTSGNGVATPQEHAARTEVAYVQSVGRYE